MIGGTVIEFESRRELSDEIHRMPGDVALLLNEQAIQAEFKDLECQTLLIG